MKSNFRKLVRYKKNHILEWLFKFNNSQPSWLQSEQPPAFEAKATTSIL
jgi:hypothetical protein